MIKISVAALLITCCMNSCKDENVEVLGVCPAVESTNPSNQEAGVRLEKIISVTFNEDMDPTTLTLQAFSFGDLSGSRTESNQELEPLAGTVTYDATTFTMHFTPTESIKSNTTYTAFVGTTVKDLFGVPLQTPYEWTFTTGVVPTVLSTDPLDRSKDVSVDKVISATFSELMDTTTINNESFTLHIGNTPVEGTITYEGTSVYFTPAAHCTACSSYVVTITTAVKNLAGVPLANNYVWSFSTK